MNIKKITGGLAAALPIVMLSGIATAADDYTMLASEIEGHARNLVCKYDDTTDPVGITWVDHDGNTQTAPVWQHKGKVGTFGCVVHASLAKQLYAEFDPNEPPVKKNGKGDAQATSKGASNDLIDGKIDSAVKHLCTFIDVIENNARLNSVDDFSPTSAYYLAMGQASTAKDWLMYDLNVDPASCYEILGGY